MTRLQLPLAALILSTGLHVATVGAVEINIPGAKASPPSSGAPAAHPTERSSSLRDGAITGSGVQANKLEIQGKSYTVVLGQTKFFRNGQTVAPNTLTKGQRVRYSLVGDENALTLAVVYVH